MSLSEDTKDGNQKIQTEWSKDIKGVFRKKQRGNKKTSKRRSEGTIGEIKKYRRSNQDISKGSKSRKSKNRQCNVQKFGNVKGEIDHGKANRVHTQFNGLKKRHKQWSSEHYTKSYISNNRQTGDKFNQTYDIC